MHKEVPHNLEAEQAILGAILADNDALNHTEDLQPDDFYAVVNQKLYESILHFRDKGTIATPVTLKRHFGDGVEGEYLASLLASSVSIVNIRDYSRIVQDLALRRRIISVSETATSRAFDGQTEFSGLDQVELIEQDLFNLTKTNEGEGFKHITPALDDVVKRAENAYKHEGRLIGLDTGFDSINRMLGGLIPPDLIILAGRPSMGKTALGTNIAKNVAQIEPVGFFSLEMSASQLSGRLISGECGVSSQNIQRGAFNSEQFGKIVEARNTMAKLKMHIDDTAAISITTLRTRARRLKRKHDIKLLVVDYLQLITTKNKGNRVQEISEITQGLKAIAKELNIPVIALSQLSRGVEQREDKRPQLADLRDSGSIEQDADIVAFVYREEYYLERLKPEDGTSGYVDWAAKMQNAKGRAEVIIAKHRNGGIGTIDMRFNGELTQFSDIDNSPIYSMAG